VYTVDICEVLLTLLTLVNVTYFSCSRWMFVYRMKCIKVSTQH